jgi:hypothetical protein
MIKIGLCVVLTTSAFLVYSPSIFSEDDFSQYDDSSYDFRENDSYPDQTLDESHFMVQEVEENEDEDDIPAPRQVNISHQSTPHYIYNSQDSYNLHNSGLPAQIPAQGEKVIIVDPKVHSWGAYSSTGVLIRQGLASAGSKWCADLGRPCRTKSGVFRIQSLGESDCISSRYPLGEGGAPMPYCMYFNGNQGLHGSNQVARANLSHGCVRLRVSDAEWLRYHFAQLGTKVIVKNY